MATLALKEFKRLSVHECTVDITIIPRIFDGITLHEQNVNVVIEGEELDKGTQLKAGT